MSDINGGGTGPGFNFPVETPSQPTPESHPDSLADGFLKDIPDADRLVVAPHIKKWDAGVTKRFQAIRDEYKPYTELGDIDTVRGWKSVMDLIDNNPYAVIDYLNQQIAEQGLQRPNAAPVGQQMPTPQTSNVDPSFAELPEAFQNRYTQLEQIVLALGNQFMQNQKSSQQAMEDQALDNAIGELHKKFGDFDEDSVIVKISRGVDPEKAVKDWQDQFNQRVAQSNRRPVPPVLNGAGGVPSGQFDPRNASRKDTRDHFAQMLAIASQQEE